MDYDPHAMTITLQASKWERRQLGYGFLLLLMFFVGTRRNGIQQDEYTLFLLVGVCMLPSIYRLSRDVGSPHLLTLNRHGVRFDNPRFRCDLIPWPRLAKAKYGWLSGRFSIIGQDGRKLLKCPGYWLGNQHLAHRSSNEINRLKSVYSDNGS